MDKNQELLQSIVVGYRIDKLTLQGNHAILELTNPLGDRLSAIFTAGFTQVINNPNLTLMANMNITINNVDI